MTEPEVAEGMLCGCGSRLIGSELDGRSYWECARPCHRVSLCFKCGATFTADDKKMANPSRVGLVHVDCVVPA